MLCLWPCFCCIIEFDGTTCMKISLFIKWGNGHSCYEWYFLKYLQNILLSVENPSFGHSILDNNFLIWSHHDDANSFKCIIHCIDNNKRFSHLEILSNYVTGSRILHKKHIWFNNQLPMVQFFVKTEQFTNAIKTSERIETRKFKQINLQCGWFFISFVSWDDQICVKNWVWMFTFVGNVGIFDLFWRGLSYLLMNASMNKLWFLDFDLEWELRLDTSWTKLSLLASLVWISFFF